ncbi:unnamed protein product [Coregonus sp. 'balchen']|nr:unnamed protein product [Coregonus sp. 'balchen']
MYPFAPDMRRDCDLAIFTDIPKSLSGKSNREGFQFFWPENSVLLTPGDTEGKLLPRNFSPKTKTHTRVPHT